MKKVTVIFNDKVKREVTKRKCTKGLFDYLVSNKTIIKGKNKETKKKEYFIKCNSYTYYLQVLSKLKFK